MLTNTPEPETKILFNKQLTIKLTIVALEYLFRLFR